MPFVIDDIAIAATEMSEVAGETAEIAGEVTESSEIIGDGIGESSLVNEKAIDAGESLNPSAPESTEIIGDGVGESALTAETVSEIGESSSISESNSFEVIADGLNESSSIETEQLDEHTLNRIDSIVDSMNKDLDSETLEKYDFNSPKTISTRNEALEGQKHPETDVPYERKTVVMDNGEKVEGVFPQFESKLDVQLPEDLEQASDNKQFSECNKQLKEKCDNDPEFRKQFTEDQLDDIAHGQTPEGYTWHHSEDKGKMQLVDYDTHMRTGHTGGRNIWGGGTENRH